MEKEKKNTERGYSLAFLLFFSIILFSSLASAGFGYGWQESAIRNTYQNVSNYTINGSSANYQILSNWANITDIPALCYENGTGCSSSSGISWATATNGTLMLASNWNATNTSYYLATNPFSFYNSTTIPAYALLSTILGFNYYNSSNFVITDYFTKSQVLGFSYYNSTNFPYTHLSNFTDNLGNRGYTNNLNFTNGANYWNDTFATFNKSYADTLYASISVVDTNETTRMNALTNTDCASGYLVIGVQSNGTVLCALDTTSGGGGNTTEEMQDAVGGAFNVTLIYDDTNNAMGINQSWLSEIITAYGYITNSTMNKSISWNELIGVPSGFSDNVDNDTTYSAGSNLTLSGTTFAVNMTSLDARYLQSYTETDPKWTGNSTLVSYLASANIFTTNQRINASLNVTDGNVSIDSTKFFCLNQACSSYITNNGTHTIWV